MPTKNYPLLPAKITKIDQGGALVHKKYNVYGLEVLILLAL